MRDSRPLLGVGVVGLGVGEQHARAFDAHPACEVRSVGDFDSERARTLAREFPGCAVAEFADMLVDPRLDVLAIASFDDAHYEQVMAALQAGKHVFVEKPMCRTLGELANIKARWREKGSRLKLRSNLVLRAAPLYVWLRDRMRAGDFGPIYSVDGDYLYGRLHKITGGWRKDVAEYSVMAGGGVHLVDLILWLTGERPVSVTANGNRLCTSATAFHFNDFVAATLDFESGLIARVTANFGCVHPHQHVLRVFGTKATFLYDDAGARWLRSRDRASPSEPLPHAPLPFNKGDLVPDFVAAILGNGDDSAEAQSFFDGISVCIAADRAVATGNRETIEYI